jgi:hypothetical protein
LFSRQDKQNGSRPAIFTSQTVSLFFFFNILIDWQFSEVHYSLCGYRNSLSRGYQLKQSSGSTTSSTSHSNITSQLNKVKLKRNASEMSKCTSTDGASPTKKREKITWP